jgi:hypothetical protein
MQTSHLLFEGSGMALVQPADVPPESPHSPASLNHLSDASRTLSQLLSLIRNEGTERHKKRR